MPCCRGQCLVEGGERGGGAKRDIEDAAVGQLEVAAHAQLRKPKRLARVRRHDADACGFEVIAHRHAAADPDAADEHLGRRERVDEQGTAWWVGTSVTSQSPTVNLSPGR